TQPNTQLQGKKFAEFMVAQGSKRVGILAVQAPFALPTQKVVGEELKKRGSELVAAVVYDKDKTTFRSEIDQVLKARPDMLYLNGYTPDVTVVLKDLYKAGYTGAKIAQAYAVNQKLLSALPPEVTEGTWAIATAPAGRASSTRSATCSTRRTGTSRPRRAGSSC